MTTLKNESKITAKYSPDTSLDFLIPDFDSFQEQLSINKENFLGGGWLEKLNHWNREISIFQQDSGRTKRKTFSINNIKELSTLCEEDHDDDSHNRARFVLTASDPLTEDNLIFAQEGRPGPANNIPSHGDMAKGKPVYSAGTIIFNKGKIIGFDHQSGDFRPGFSSLLPVLYLLAQKKNASLLADSVTLTELDSSGKAVYATVIDTSTLQTLQLPKKPDLSQQHKSEIKRNGFSTPSAPSKASRSRSRRMRSEEEEASPNKKRSTIDDSMFNVPDLFLFSPSSRSRGLPTPERLAPENSLDGFPAFQ